MSSAALLTRAGYDVTLFDHWVGHIDEMKQNGLRLSGPLIGDIRVPVNAKHLYEAQEISEPFDLGFVAVKSYDTEWASAFISPLVREDGAIVDFQNGINDERVAAVVGRERTLGCVITIGAGMYDPGHCIRTDTRTLGFKIGELDGSDSDRARDIAAMMNHVAGAESTTNLWGERWGKLAVNCMANPVAGLSGYGSGRGPRPRRHSLALHPHRRRGRPGRPSPRPQHRGSLGHRLAEVSSMSPTAATPPNWTLNWSREHKPWEKADPASSRTSSEAAESRSTLSTAGSWSRAKRSRWQRRSTRRWLRVVRSFPGWGVAVGSGEFGVDYGAVGVGSWHARAEDSQGDDRRRRD